VILCICGDPKAALSNEGREDLLAPLKVVGIQASGRGIENYWLLVETFAQ
jgi:hypothetical protein